jgi:predicted anti-sigma-YlaC factor YlaD
MTNLDLDKLLGADGADPGCDAAGELMDAYCEAVSSGEPLSARFEEFVRHMHNCTACREDIEGLLAMLREQEEPDTR